MIEGCDCKLCQFDEDCQERKRQRERDDLIEHLDFVIKQIDNIKRQITAMGKKSQNQR